jgi:hypothetical protein
MNGDEMTRLWEALDEVRQTSTRNGEKLDTLVVAIDRMGISLFGNGQPGLRERLFKLEASVIACQSTHREEREETKLVSRLSRSTQLAIWLAVGAGLFNLATIAIHAYAGK